MKKDPSAATPELRFMLYSGLRRAWLCQMKGERNDANLYGIYLLGDHPWFVANLYHIPVVQQEIHCILSLSSLAFDFFSKLRGKE